VCRTTRAPARRTPRWHCCPHRRDVTRGGRLRPTARSAARWRSRGSATRRRGSATRRRQTAQTQANLPFPTVWLGTVGVAIGTPPHTRNLDRRCERRTACSDDAQDSKGDAVCKDSDPKQDQRPRHIDRELQCALRRDERSVLRVGSWARAPGRALPTLAEMEQQRQSADDQEGDGGGENRVKRPFEPPNHGSRDDGRSDRDRQLLGCIHGVVLMLAGDLRRVNDDRPIAAGGRAPWFFRAKGLSPPTQWMCFPPISTDRVGLRVIWRNA
jgi:hypothetical protein